MYNAISTYSERLMKIGILSRNKDLYSTKRLVQAAKKRGHYVEVVDVNKCYMNITSNSPEVHYGDVILDHFDAVIPRIGASATFYGTAVLRQFEMAGIYSVNESVAITRSRDKLRAHQLLSRKGIGIPTTAFAHSTQNSDELIDLCGGAPVIIKLLEGTQGKGVILAETDKTAESIIEAFRNLDAYFLVQEFIKEAGGSDIRCFVVGNKVVGTMQRTAKEGEFRSNLHKGGSSKPVEITAKEKQTAIAAARAMGLNVAGVDIVRSKRGPLVLEVNSSPGLEGIEKTTKKDIAGKIIRYIEENAAPNKNKTKGKG
jgi:ribosomal protein S6--L-glutamate ligase